MAERYQTDNPELDDLFERYRAAPKSQLFAPLADACRKAGMLDEALEICARGVGDHPRYASGHVVQGKCLYDAGRVNDAQAAFDRVLVLDPKNLVALKYLGMIHAERGDTARAKEFFEHILALDPGDREIRSRIEDVSHHRPAASTKVPAAAPSPAPQILVPITQQAEPVEEEPIELPDVEDESFRGEPITLRDETVTSDEIATMTLADIYAAQGYTTRALRIYHEVLRRQPHNAALAEKIAALEKSQPAPAPVVEAPVATVPASRPESAPAASPRTAPAHEPAAARPASSAGHPIDQSRNYEQFKRWLKTSSR